MNGLNAQCIHNDISARHHKDIQPFVMKLLVIIPALNEEATIGDVVKCVPRAINGVTDVQVLVVDDGSTDTTAIRAKAAGATVVRHKTNRGVGSAFATGVQAALDRGADLVVSMDGDGQFAPEHIPNLLRPLLNDNVGFVTCTRFPDPELIPSTARKSPGRHSTCTTIPLSTSGSFSFIRIHLARRYSGSFPPVALLKKIVAEFWVTLTENSMTD